MATDTQKNTAFAFAKEHGIRSPEEYLLRLSEHFVSGFDWIEGGLWQAEQYEWERILVDGQPHDHAFVRKGQGTRLAAVQVLDGATHVTGGVKDLTVLKSTGSEFAGFPRDRYTTLVETDDRIMATSVTGRWRFLPEAVAAGIDYNGLYAELSAVLLSTFATVHSLALQQTLFAMGKAAIEARPEIAEVRFAMPNKHHFLYDLAPFGLDNPGEVFYAADRPYGLIEGTITRDGAAPAPDAWVDLPAVRRASADRDGGALATRGPQSVSRVTRRVRSEGGSLPPTPLERWQFSGRPGPDPPGAAIRALRIRESLCRVASSAGIDDASTGIPSPPCSAASSSESTSVGISPVPSASGCTSAAAAGPRTASNAPMYGSPAWFAHLIGVEQQVQQDRRDRAGADARVEDQREPLRELVVDRRRHRGQQRDADRDRDDRARSCC